MLNKHVGALGTAPVSDLFGESVNLWMLGMVVTVLAAGAGASLLADARRSGDPSR